MRGFAAVMRKEFVHIRREPRLVGYVLGLPVVLLLLFGFALRLRVDPLTVAVVDEDGTFLSLQVRDRLAREPKLALLEADSEDAVRELLGRGRVHVAVIIPKGFSRQAADGRQTTFRVLVDGTMPTLAQQALYGAQVLTGDDVSAALAFDDEDGGGAPRPRPIGLDDRVLYNPDLKDSAFFLPGTIGIVILLVALSLSTGLVREKEQQTIEQLCATPLTPLAIIGGKIVPYGIITMLDFAVVAVLARAVFDLPLNGSLVAVIAIGALFVFAILALGALIAALAQTQLQAHFINVFFFIMCVCLSGFVFPIEAMPRILHPVAYALPMTYFIEAIRAFTLKGTPAVHQARDFVALAAFVVGLGGLSLASFRKQVG
jgi:ABC-type multidrug transport system permease subunit